MGMNLRLSAEEDQQLTELARREGRSKNQVIAGLIRKEWEQIAARSIVEHELEGLLTSRAGLMRRLADA